MKTVGQQINIKQVNANQVFIKVVLRDLNHGVNHPVQEPAFVLLSEHEELHDGQPAPFITGNVLKQQVNQKDTGGISIQLPRYKGRNRNGQNDGIMNTPNEFDKHRTGSIVIRSYLF